MANKEVLVTIIIYNLLLIAIGFWAKKEPVTKMIFILVVEV